MNKKTLSVICILLAGILWGCMGLFVRPLTDRGLTTWDIVFLRAIGTTLILGLFLLITNRKAFRIKLKDLWCFLGTGLLSIVFFNYCYFKEITLTSLSVAAILLYTAPAFVILISAPCFGERITGRKLLSLLLTFAGLVFVTGVIGDAGLLSGPSILIGLGAGLGYALYSIFGRYALARGYSSLTISFYTFLFAAIGSLFFTNPVRIYGAVTNSWKELGLVVIFVLVSTVIPYITYTIGLRHVENGRASIIASIEPVVATLNGVIFFHEGLSLWTGIGIALVLCGILLCNLRAK